MLLITPRCRHEVIKITFIKNEAASQQLVLTIVRLISISLIGQRNLNAI